VTSRSPSTKRATPDAVWRLRVTLQPRAAQTRIVGWHGGAVKVQVHAAPVDGAANTALIAVLADALHVPRRAVRIVQGASSRQKLLEISTEDPGACQRRLDDVLNGRVDKPLLGD